MKKSFLILICIFIVTGCNSKSNETINDKITCTKNEESEGLTSTSKTIVYFENNSISKYQISIDTKVPEKYQNIIDTLYNEALTSFNEYKDYSGVDVESNKGKDTIKASMTVTKSKIKDIDKEKINELLDLSSNKETIKNSFEANEYTCK